MGRRRLFLVAYAASGTAALIYEVAWARLLALVIGHAVAAVSTVLAAFMGGLAVGAAIGGRLAPRVDRSRALRTYAILELATGASALLLPFALSMARPALAAAYADGPGGAWFGLLRITISLAVLAVPAALMGATFPVAVRWYAGSDARAAADAGALYAVNTVGATGGAGLAAFVLLPLVGLRSTTLIAVALNVSAAALALVIARGAGAPAALPTRPAAGTPPRSRRRPRVLPALDPPRPVVAAMALGLSGFVALVFEVVWTRLLALIVGPTTYAFGLLIAAFIGGLAVGSTLGVRLVTRLRRPLPALGFALVAVGLGGLLVVAIAGHLPLVMARFVARPDVLFGSVMRAEAAVVVVVLLPTTVALGAAFPLGVAAATRGQASAARDAALVYAGNTVGAIAGSLAAGFLFIPTLGIRTTTLAAAAGAAWAGLAVVLVSRGGRARTVLAAGAALVTVLVALALPAWNRTLLSSGAYKSATYLQNLDVRTGLEAGTLLYYAEGAAGTVTVRRLTGTLSLAIDGKVDASNGGDMLTQRLLAHLPMLLHGPAGKICIIGLGSGVTLGSALRYPIERADVVEISPQVVAASAFFDRENDHGLSDPRTQLVLGDGRTHLLLGNDRYDVIISEPSNPWMAGVASLFTREFFQAMRARLAPGGVVCQWAHTYDIAESDLRSIVATFLAVFPHGSLWLIGNGDVLLIAGQVPIGTLVGHLEEGLGRPEVAADLATVGVQSPFGLLSLFVADGSTLRAYVDEAPIQDDDRLALEFSTPRGIYGRTTVDNDAILRDLAARTARPEPIDAVWRTAGAAQWKERGLMLLQANATTPAFTALSRAAGLAPDDAVVLDALGHAAMAGDRVDEALALVTRLAEQPRGRIQARIEAARLLASTGRYDEAVGVSQQALADEPGNRSALAQLASIYADAQDAAHLGPIVQTLEARAPGTWPALYYSAVYAFLEGRVDECLSFATQAVPLAPPDGRTLDLLGAAYATLGRVEEAKHAFEASLARDPRDPTSYVNLGQLEMQSGDPGRAAGHFSEALMLDPASAAAREGLARAWALLGDTGRGRALEEAARTSSPVR